MKSKLKNNESNYYASECIAAGREKMRLNWKNSPERSKMATYQFFWSFREQKRIVWDQQLVNSIILIISINRNYYRKPELLVWSRRANCLGPLWIKSRTSKNLKYLSNKFFCKFRHGFNFCFDPVHRNP